MGVMVFWRLAVCNGSLVSFDKHCGRCSFVKTGTIIHQMRTSDNSGGTEDGEGGRMYVSSHIFAGLKDLLSIYKKNKELRYMPVKKGTFGQKAYNIPCCLLFIGMPENLSVTEKHIILCPHFELSASRSRQYKLVVGRVADSSACSYCLICFLLKKCLLGVHIGS